MTHRDSQHDGNAVRTFHGHCHCGAVRFEADFDPAGGLSRCNCTFCRRRASVTALMKPDAFRLLAGDDAVRYSHGFYFCKRCGIHTHAAGHVEQLGGDIVTVNVNCLEDFEREGHSVAILDGRGNTW